MAIFHLRVSTISRSKGGSAIAAYCYRNGTKARDPRLGITYDYRNRRNGVASRFVEGWDGSKLALWQAAESAERKKNSCVAREIQVSLPRELTSEQGERLTRRFAQFIVSEYGVAVDAVVHRKASKSRPDHNPHSHLLLTTRTVKDGVLGEKTRVWDELIGKKETLPDGTTIYHEPEGKKQVEKVRRVWAEFANNALADAGSVERIDHRSDAARGIERTSPARSIPRGALARQQREYLATPKVRERERKRQNAERQASQALQPQKVSLGAVLPPKLKATRDIQHRPEQRNDGQPVKGHALYRSTPTRAEKRTQERREEAIQTELREDIKPKRKALRR